MELTLKKIEIIRKKILENAHQLLEDAVLLLRNKRWARAFGLTHLASEELAKLLMLHTAAIHIIRGKKFDFKTLNKRLNNHKAKIRNILVMEVLLTTNDDKIGPRNLKEYLERGKRFYNFKGLREVNLDVEVNKFNNLKNNCLYAQFFKGEILKPSEIITEEMAREYFRETVERI